MRSRYLLPAICVGLLALPGLGAPPDFARDVRPILSQHCFKCHGPDDHSRQGGLRLDDRDSALRGGDSQIAAIVPGDLQASELIQRITSSDPDLVMPPPSTKRVLTAEQIDTLQRWVAAEAAYSKHWAFQPIDRPPVPTRSGPASNPIDVFVAQTAAAHELDLSAPADRATWMRRVYLDLLGVPPSYEEVAAYQLDQRPDAQDRLIDRVLASPQLGERWARRWLDLARYADTNGYEKDRPRVIWPYRNWVIDAINDDLPQNQFAIEQLAGDLLPEATQQQRIATGFHRNTMINEEGGIDPLEYRYYAMVDRVNTTSTAWLGMTVACAQCHDHKYDPISQRDYFGMMALLNNAEEPEMEVFEPAIAQAQQAIDQQIRQLEEQRPFQFALPEDQQSVLPASILNVHSQHGLIWQAAKPQPVNDSPPKAQSIPIKWTSSGAVPDVDTTSIQFAPPSSPAQSTTNTTASPTHLIAIRLKAVGQTEDPTAAVGWSDSRNFVITRAQLRDAQDVSLTFSHATASYEQSGYPAAGTLDTNTRSGWAVDGHGAQACEITWHLAQPLALKGTGPLKLQLEQDFGGRHLLQGFQLTLVCANQTEAQPDARLAHAIRQFAAWREKLAATTADWTLVQPTAANANMARLVPQSDGSLLAIGDISKRDEYLFELKELPAGTAAIMVEALPDSSMPRRGPGRTYYEGPIGDFFLSEVELTDSSSHKLKLREAIVDFAQAGREADKVLDGDPLTGWSIDGQQGQAHRLVLRLDQPLSQPSTVALRLLFERYYAAPLGRVRLWATSSPALEMAASYSPELQAELAPWRTGQSNQSTARPTDEVQLLCNSDLGKAFLNQASEVTHLNQQIALLRNQRPNFTKTMVMQPRPDGFLRETRRYHRGEFLQPRETTEAAVPKFLESVSATRPSNRLELAQWLMSPEHPLTARVLANRYWSSLMGRGVVSTGEDFGFQGSFPTHGPLLDWLASELVGQNLSAGDQRLMWSLKRWLRLVVSSDAYARASSVTAASLAQDPSNLLLARASRRRLDAEQLRDAALVTAGLLSRTIGGPSVYPPQPSSITTEGTYGQLSWPESHGADRYRRSLYTFTKRTAPFAMLATFDAPSGEACVARRESTDTPLQALTVLNDTLFLEAAKELGYRTIERAPGAPPEAIVTQLFQRILLRQPTTDELHELKDYFTYQVSKLEQTPTSLAALGVGNSETLGPANHVQPDARVAAATLLARVLLNTDEFINRN